jgi:hypothetical protein
VHSRVEISRTIDVDAPFLTAIPTNAAVCEFRAAQPHTVA